jgi:hypothetical protein
MVVGEVSNRCIISVTSKALVVNGQPAQSPLSRASAILPSVSIRPEDLQMINKATLLCAGATLCLLLSGAALAEDDSEMAAKKAAEEAESAATLEAASFAESESSTQEAETEAEIEKDDKQGE